MKKYENRKERFFASKEKTINVQITINGNKVDFILNELSASGFLALTFEGMSITKGSQVGAIVFLSENERIQIDDEIVEIKRIEELKIEQLSSKFLLVAFKFKNDQDDLIKKLSKNLRSPSFVSDELSLGHSENIVPTTNALEHTALDYYNVDSKDLFEKCHQFSEMIRDLQHKELYQTMYRVTLTSGLDHRITAFNPITRKEEEFICFDSNSYLGMHIHPKVIETTRRVLKQVGYGTPSAQLLCGTNRYLRELEETISEFHGKEDTMIFSAGYNANVGAIFALVRKNDMLLKDRFSHASIHDACRMLDAPRVYSYPHMDHEKLEKYLKEANENDEIQGKLVVTDGVFSMHGTICDLPKLSGLCKKYGAKLMVDEAHSVGILGKNGRGVEDHFNLPNSVDVLMGTFSKAPGTCGGYVAGSKELVYYLRFYANAGVFTASLPASTCAGITEAFKIMKSEPEHRENLWANTNKLATELINLGFILPKPESPILTVFMGTNQLLWSFSKELFMRGIKCGNVAFPAVPNGEAILRITMNARHTDEDISKCVEVMKEIALKFGILNKTKKEIREIGKMLLKNELR